MPACRMRSLVLLSLLFAAVVTSVGLGQEPPRITPEQAGSRVGQVATICSPVVNVTCEDAGISLTLAMKRGDARVRLRFPEFPATALGTRPDRLLGYNVCATGNIARTQSGHEIVLTDASVLESLQATLASEVRVFGPDAHHLCEADVKSPRLRRGAPPNYTSATKSAGIRGNVFLQAVVLANGKVGDVRVVSGLHPELDRASVAAMKTFEFDPGTYNDAPASVTVAGEMAFEQ
jgi:TonB family protein